MMTTLSANTTVGELVVERPGRSRVFEQYGIDYCCGGRVPLERACAEKGVDPEAVLADLRAADQNNPGGDETDWTEAPLAALADHIEQTHHAYLREELPRLSAMAAKVREVHGRQHPELVEVERVFGGLRDELRSHMMKEEQVLFPLIRRLGTQQRSMPGHCASVAEPIQVMEMEHDDAGEALSRLRELTGGFTPPEDGCNTYRALFDGLATLESDLHIHIHKENNILFPRAMRDESQSR